VRTGAAVASTPVDTAEAVRQQRLADLKAARESGLMAQTTGGRGTAGSIR
jgi:type IV secretion system protein VirB10